MSPIKNSRHSRGIALVVTLLMLSVITFLAVAFLVLTRSQRTTATVVLDSRTAQEMSEAALARAQAEIISQMQTAGRNQTPDILRYDYMASANIDIPPTNVTDAVWAQAIGQMYQDPRPPVFVQTNLSFPNLDYRFWVDLNRNGSDEPSGFLNVLDGNGNRTDASNYFAGASGSKYFFTGEPEWIGVTEYPEYTNSATNRFIGRYAYLVLPAGKTADLNFIHNYSKNFLGGAVTPALPPAGTPSRDGYIRDQGVGTWELNLAALLLDDNTNTYASPNPSNPYTYVPGQNPNTGYCFDDAFSFMRFRYGANYGNPYPQSLASFFPQYASSYSVNGIDEYGTAPYGFTNSVLGGWPGGYTANNYDDILQDLFDPTKTSANFTNNLTVPGTNLDSYNRYTFQRLLASVGTGSAPELQTYVYDDGFAIFPGSMPLRLRNKVNINYDNTYQIFYGLNTSASQLTNGIFTPLAPWPNALAFFTNAAESLVRSQEYPFTNTFFNFFTQQYQFGTNYNHFGLTNIPVYSATNGAIRYSENLHRMLQLAANIYDATRTNASPILRSAAALTAYPPFPSVFRPQFATDGTNLYIIGYVDMSHPANVNQMLSQIEAPFVDFTTAINMSTNFLLNANVWGIPWVVGAVKGVPQFDRFTSANDWFVERKLLFARYLSGTGTNIVGDPTRPPQYTNQYYCMLLTNISGMDAWNTYSTNWVPNNPFEVFASNYITITITNNSPLQNPFGTTIGLTNYGLTTFPTWRRFNVAAQTNSMLAFLQTNVISLTGDYFSEKTPGSPQFWPVGYSNVIDPTALGTNFGSNSFQLADRVQTVWPAYAWTLTVTNHLVYCLLDSGTGQIYDFVNLGPFGTALNFTNFTNPQGYAGTLANGRVNGGANANPWDPTTPAAGGMNQGVLNQIANAAAGNTFFQDELSGQGNTNNEPYFGPPGNPPIAMPYASQTWIVNDPIVHYTLGDLTRPNLDTNQVLTVNDRYEPWPSPYTSYNQNIGANMTFKDPLMYGSDFWSFPTNVFPSIGWLGRVHRGTPWQTIFLKSDSDNITNAARNFFNWTNEWVSTSDTYPTGDYALLDLFTATPNDNAASGQVSINQVNSAPWYAVMAGVTVPNAKVGLEQIPATTPDLDFIISGPVGINATRNNFQNNLFHRLGSILATPALTVDSPFLGTDPRLMSDEAVEAIPQQTLGLLKVGYPQFVIYGFGQSLKPKDLYFGAANFNLCTNYQITGEYVTRMVCHVVGAPDASNVKIQVDSYNILPGN